VSNPVIFQIEDGVVALAVVNKAASGYLDSWQAPGGKTATTATIADYDADGDDWRCQVTSGALTSSASNSTTTIPATFCQPSEERPNPGVTSYSLDLSFLQDPIVRAGLSSFLFQHDTEEAYFLLGLNGDGAPPAAVGRVRLVAGNFGGAARDNLSADVSFGVVRKPDIVFGTTGSTRLIKGDGTVTNVGAGAARPAAAKK
jgi:hypothetical protein